MIKTEYYRTRGDGVRLSRTFSDKGMMIRSEAGVLYTAAVDPEELNRQYEETDIPIPDRELTERELMKMMQEVL